MPKINENRVLAPKKSLCRGFHNLYELSSCFGLGFFALSALVLALHSKWRKQRKEQSYTQYYVTHRIRIVHQISEPVPIACNIN